MIRTAMLALALSVSGSALAAAEAAPPAPAKPAPAKPAPAKPADARDVVTTGVARGRDRLDSAISTSAISSAQISDLSARSGAEIFRYIPGVRADFGAGEGNSNLTIRGLPMASTGSKYVQLEEDGLPVLEYGDITLASADMFLRADGNLAQVESIRGGSASTFASNSPGGVINLISKTGETAGGSAALGTGLSYGEHRLDADYGAPLGEGLRFHIGGFYRAGEGVRHLGYDGEKGGQVKANITKSFEGGYVRLSVKYLDDRTPFYGLVPVYVGGTNAAPQYQTIAGLSLTQDSLLSPYTTTLPHLDQANRPVTDDNRYGQRVLSKAVGLEAQVTLAGWTLTDRFRFESNSGNAATGDPVLTGPAALVAGNFAGAGALLSYASGPNAGEAITNPAALGGNGLLTASILVDNRLNSLDYLVNDFRAGRVWPLGGGELTATAGYYASRQTISVFRYYAVDVQDVVGGGQAALVNIATAAGYPVTQGGFVSFSSEPLADQPSAAFDIRYDTRAGFGSLNFHKGRLAVGGSLRYDYGSARGTTYGGGNGAGYAPVDLNGDGTVSYPEAATGVLPLSQPAPVNYDYHYLSYSAGVNFRAAQDFAVFARYSRGARVNADRLLFTGVIDSASGALDDPQALVDHVRQAEAGAKYRTRSLALNLTAFYAHTTDHNAFFGPIIERSYRDIGLELEGSYCRGPFQISAGATYTDARILADPAYPVAVGNVPQRQPRLIVQAVPQLSLGPVVVGAALFHSSGSFVQDFDLLTIPGYTTVSPFVELRLANGLRLGVNVNNVFDATGITYIFDSGLIQAGGFQSAQTVPGRSVAASLRASF